MAKVVPGGSGATRALPPNLLDPAPLTRWDVVYEVDFTTILAGTTDLKTAGAQVLNGVTWAPELVANATSFDIINGTGLRIVPNTGGFWTAGATAPRLHAFVVDGSAYSMSQLVTGATPYDTIAFQFLLTVNTDVSRDGDSGGMATGNNTGTDYLTLCRAQEGGAKRTAFRGEGSGGNDSYYVTTASAKVFHELVVFPGGGMSGYATADTTFADPLTRTSDFKSAGIMGADVVYPTTNFDIFGDGTNWRLWLFAGIKTGGGVADGTGSYTFTKFRVLKAKWS